ncbi:23S rRNA (cytidine-2'-O)-methyltransferase TlyA [Campylobacter sp. RM16704]|uniref:23S rRNA (cytidine-2'-O)-methyltransferase TlyA n=1 Tax=Campylobacter sp. RM16704 TaxID=1500960 RepID=UPI00057EB87D|nr:TlyA family RNA methyltransferase [Campylobacter sp. RM16704]AJC86317.1 16S/23S rRNA (cytidine-2'-O)-methyltransferase [Campylobacter sp. RM16704]
MRFDIFVSTKLNISRNKACEIIENKQILLNGEFKKTSFKITCQNPLEDESLKLTLLEELFVSRAAFKLKHFLQNNTFVIKDKICLDIGSSTGGFVQILHQNKAKHITALDVGTNQLHESLRSLENIQIYENTDLREFKSENLYDVITCDVSFISLMHLIFYIDKFAKNLIILLFKPQFEVGKEAKRDKNGVVKDIKAINQAKDNFEKACAKLGWILQTTQESHLKGKEGNAEFFYAYTKA